MRHATQLMLALGLTLCAGTTFLSACGSEGEDSDSLLNQSDELKSKKKSKRACGGLTGLACKDGEFCSYAEEAICGAADATGLCAPIPEFCTKEYAPVCGCDGQTYGNECMANAAGVSAASKGECADGEPGGEPTVPAPGCGGEGDGGVVSPQICGGIAGLACNAGAWCNYEVGAGGTGCGVADASGVCQLFELVLCTEQYEPVCGCDGQTYGNDCQAHASGVSIASEGECGGTAPGETVCGGFRGAQCAKDEFCDFEGHTSECGFADGTGICEKKPEICTLEYAPVCGCDGKTYGNSCAANAAGVSVASKGECGAPAELVNCDQRDVLCRRATPKCPGGTVPSVVGSCYGDCVAVDQCACREAAECPQPDFYTCHLSAGHCGPFVN